MEERKIVINNLKVNYKTAGKGPAVLILHGWGGSSDSWLKVQEILADNGYNVICPDFPGFGKTKTPSSIWGIDDYVKLVFDFTNSQNLDKFFLIGHSFGGRVAVRFSRNYPKKIKRLVLCDSAGIKSKPSFFQKLIYLAARTGNAIFGLKHLDRFKNGARNAFYIFLRNKDYVKANKTMKGIIKKVLEKDLSADLPKINTKTLIICGENDKMVPKRFAYIFKEKMKNSELKILPEIGHSPHLECPEKLCKIILDFLKRQKYRAT